MPYMTHSIAESNPYNPTDYVIYMRPSYTQALVDVIVHSEWEHVFFIYDSDEGDFLNFLTFLANDLFKHLLPYPSLNLIAFAK